MRVRDRRADNSNTCFVFCVVDQKNNPVTASTDREIVISRVLDAPRTLVFDVWTEPKHVGEWYGPRGFTRLTS
jgi:hypothetical protein